MGTDLEGVQKKKEIFLEEFLNLVSERSQEGEPGEGFGEQKLE